MRRIIRRQVKVSVQADCEVWWTQKAKEMEEAQKAGNARRLLQLIRATGPPKIPVHIHFCNWSSRYDTWYPITSNCLRALKRVSTSVSSANTKVSNNQDDLSLSADKAPRTTASPPTHFELGSYVMASWKNEYEYLAEVIAHRHRQGDNSQYRLRYVWDNVIEWTPIHRMRKATQFEIDYVLKFCREHVSSSAGKRPSDCPLKINSRESRIGVSEGKSTRSVTTGSEVKNKESGPKVDGVIQTSRPTQSSPSPGTTSVERKTTPISSPCFDSVEQDDMVYDKTVLQFHEACRKRRELKRQAIEPNQQAVAKVEDRSSRTNDAASETSESRSATANDASMLSSPEPDIKPAKVARLAEQTVVSPKSSPKPSVRPVSSPATDLVPDKTEIIPVTSSIKPPAGTITPAAVSSVKKPAASPRPKMETEKKVTPTVAKQSQPLVTAPPKSRPPVIYPCPYCPRQLRHSKLLAAHISNYHKDVAHPANSVRGVTTKSTRIVRSSPKRLESPVIAERTQPTSTLPPSMVTSVVNTVKSAPKSPGPSKPMRVLCCIRCDNHCNVTDNYPGLIQCSSCLCCMHEACYGVSSATASPGRRTFLCDGCLLKTRPARQSRMDEALLDAYVRGGEFPWSLTKEESTMRKLVSETSDLLHWSYKLRPLIDTGWTILNGAKAPSPPIPDPMLPTHRPTTHKEKDNVTGKKQEENPSRLQDSHETSANEEHVNRLYMALRESLVDGGSEPRPSRRSLSNSLSDETPFPSSLPDSECPTTCWPLTDDVDGNEVSIVDPHLSQQVLTGFLQELGPNVISEFVDLGTDPTAGDVEVADVSYFLPRNSIEKSIPQQSSGETQSDVGSLPVSTTETPTKGLGSLLSSPSGVTSLLQATVSRSLSSNNRFDRPLSQNGVIDGPPSPILLRGPLSMDLAFPSENFPAKCLPTKLDGPPRSPTSDKNADVSSNPINATGISTVVDFMDDPLLNVPTSEAPSQPGNQLHTPTQCPGSTPISRESEICSGPPGACATAANLSATDVDWFTVTTVANGPYQSPVTSSVPSSKSSLKETLCHPAIMYDTLGSSATFSLDAITDTLTPEDVSGAHLELDQLDQFILTPLERTLSIMESHLDSVTAQLITLEQGMNWSASPKPLARRAFDMTEQEVSEYYIPSSETSSAFGSSPSLSLSPTGIHEEVLSGINHFCPRSAISLSDRCTKQAARQLYRFTSLQRCADTPLTASNTLKHGSTRLSPGRKNSSLFSKRLPSTIRLLDDRL
ncbi:glutamate receptor AMPA [Clonorchis sinensis]|uniref:Glutamate receptor AMPA n=1 Tax=Clonorchis sinensis TaxID=79923 RepID=G7Y3P4_CLOSI|nr:glutamate receptor AMPA [Clonorchis sinensis]